MPIRTDRVASATRVTPIKRDFIATPGTQKFGFGVLRSAGGQCLSRVTSPQLAGVLTGGPAGGLGLADQQPLPVQLLRGAPDGVSNGRSSTSGSAGVRYVAVGSGLLRRPPGDRITDRSAANLSTVAGAVVGRSS